MSQGFDGSKLTPNISDQVALKVLVDVDGTETTTYVATGKIGALEASASWSCKKIVSDTATGITRVTWAEAGGVATPRFVHVATDLTALTYS